MISFGTAVRKVRFTYMVNQSDLGRVMHVYWSVCAKQFRIIMSRWYFIWDMRYHGRLGVTNEIFGWNICAIPSYMRKKYSSFSCTLSSAIKPSTFMTFSMIARHKTVPFFSFLQFSFWATENANRIFGFEQLLRASHLSMLLMFMAYGNGIINFLC